MLPHHCSSFTPARPCRAPKPSGARGLHDLGTGLCVPLWGSSRETELGGGKSARASPGKGAVGVAVTAPAGLTCILKKKRKKTQPCHSCKSQTSSPSLRAGWGFVLLRWMFQTLMNLFSFINYPGLFVLLLLVPPAPQGLHTKESISCSAN